MKDRYKTIKNQAESLHKAKGSRFLGFALPLRSEEEFKSSLSHIRKQYHDASHHCYAWRLGPDPDRYRVNDDGEPSGSAGNPIFGQIQSKDLTNLAVIVVRYFGGTLLGVGGLISAYRTATSVALENALIIDEKVYRRFRVDFKYPQMNHVMKIIKDFHLGMEEQQFELECSVTLVVWLREEKRVKEKLGRVEGCRVTDM